MRNQDLCRLNDLFEATQSTNYRARTRNQVFFFPDLCPYQYHYHDLQDGEQYWTNREQLLYDSTKEQQEINIWDGGGGGGGRLRGLQLLETFSPFYFFV